ncbi:hypothetical protein FJT64_012388 [Amphibalanus amphitrite]|uniref:Uncharacterized protein n=1 Tax=Amphibalanus amphitrite TaxID=1232801 RepID=A0A6A4V6K7_AMPAM|nr:hypothetical protein FJT64_012388 [Amphibalanus amphitrite]
MNLFFLMTLLAGHGQTISRARIQKEAANTPLVRADCEITPEAQQQVWNGLEAGGGAGQRQYRELASIVYKYVRDIPTYSISDQAQLRGMAAFQLVARLHIEYARVDLQSRAIAGQSECMALKAVFQNL